MIFISKFILTKHNFFKKLEVFILSLIYIDNLSQSNWLLSDDRSYWTN